jgi:hypothetical protein
MELFICQYCGSERHNFRSLIQHERLCKSNSNRHKIWNEGLTSNDDIRIKIGSEKASESLSKNHPNKGKPLSSAAKNKISNTRKELFKKGLVCGKNKVNYYKNNLDKRTCFYVVEFKNATEHFLKIGISEVGVEKRFKSGYERYEICILEERYLNAYFAALLERKLLRKYREFYAYNPKNFNGRTDCLILYSSKFVIEDLNKEILGYSGDGEDSKPIAIEFNSLIPRHKKTSEELSLEAKLRNDVKNKERNSKLRPFLEKIDFSKRGAFTLASSIIGITPQKAKKFVQRNFPDLIL